MALVLRHWRVGAALLVGVIVATVLAASQPAVAEEQAADVELTAVEIPSDAEALRRWLTIWDVNDLVLLLDDFYRQLGPVRMCPSGGAVDQRCYLDFTRRGGIGGAVPPGGQPPAGPGDDVAEAEAPPRDEPSDPPEPSPEPEPASPVPEPSPSTPPAPAPAPTAESEPSRAPVVLDETPARSSSQTIERRIVDLVNADRQREGLPPLQADDGLVEGARAWTAVMAERDELAHDPNLSVPPNARTAGENVAFRTTGGDVADRLHQQFMRSPGHRRNVLNPEFSSIGVGVVQSDGLTWVTERFAG